MANDKTPNPVRGSRADGSSFYDASYDTPDRLNVDLGYVGARNYLEQAMRDMGIATWSKGVDFGRSSGKDAGNS